MSIWDIIWNKKKKKPLPTHVVVDEDKNIVMSGSFEECVMWLKLKDESGLLDKDGYWVQQTDQLS